MNVKNRSNEKLKKDGNFFIENFLNENEKKDLKLFFNEKFNNKNLASNTIKFNFQELNNFSILDRIEKKISNFLKYETDYKFYLRNIWMIKTRNEDFKETELPFIPHIDKKRYLKVFLYVDDVEEKDGPFSVCLGVSPSENEKKRLLWTNNDNKNEHGLLYHNDITHIKKMIFKAGTIICFDTNVPHFAGKVEKNGCRKVLRFNYFSTFSEQIDFNFTYRTIKNKLSRLKYNLFNKR